MRNHGAFILARYSTDRQNPDSIEVQVEKCSEWCHQNGIPILGVFADMAVSGMKDSRPQYDLMMRQLRQDMADMVVIYDQSRMFRKMTAWFSFRDELAALGVSVVSVTQPLIGKDLRDPTNFLTEGSTALFNQIWALQTRQKVIEKMRYMARNGQHTGGTPPLGYCVVDGKLAVCEPEAAIVRRIFQEYADGMTYRNIIAGLNQDGMTTRSGKPFGTNSLHDLLKNKKYIGILVYGKTPRSVAGTRNSHGQNPDDIIEIEDAIPAIVDRNVWEKVREKMERNKRSQAGRPATVRNYPLKGKVFCGECGAALIYTGSKNSNARYHYYSCSGKQRHGNCELMPIRMETLEHAVAEAVRKIVEDPKKTKQLVQIMRDEKSKLQTGCADQLQALLLKQREINRQLEHATDAILSGLSSRTLLDKINDLEQEKEAISRSISALKRSVDSVSILDDRFDELFSMAMQDDEAVLSIVARVEVSKDTITIWTIFDTDPNGKIDYSEHFNELSYNSADFIEIPGSGSPAPRNTAPHLGCCISLCRRTRTHLNTAPRWGAVRHRLDGDDTLI